MLRFENIEFLYGLLLIPAFIFIFWIMRRWKVKAMKSFGDLPIIGKLISGFSKSRPVLKFSLLMLAYVFLIIGIANPQIGSKLKEAKRKGIDLVIALDVSNSMLAEDITPNRLERAKQAVSSLIDRLEGDRLGVIIFAGNAYMQLPVTTDYAAAKMFLSTISTKTVPTQGTAIGEAIETAANAFDDSDHSKAIVIITDGENHEDDAIEQASLANEKGIKVYTLGMGLAEGAPIPIYNKFGNQEGFKKDNQNQTVITKLNERMLQQIASAGNGIYVRANNTKAGLDKIFDKINQMEEREFETRIYSDYEDRFQYLLGAALLLLILETLIVERKSKWAGKINLFG